MPRLVVHAAFLCCMAAAAHAAPLSSEQAAARVAAEYGVEVLKVEETTLRGRRVFLLTVMNPGGDFNEAFGISTIAMDPDTGQLVPAFAHRASGIDANESPQFETNRQPTEATRPGLLPWR